MHDSHLNSDGSLKEKRAAQLLRIIETFARDSRLPLPESGVGLDLRLETDLGLDSLSRSELLSRIEKSFGLSLAEEALAAATPRDLLDLIGQGPELATPSRAQRPIVDDHRLGEPSSALTLLDTLHWHLEQHPERTHIIYRESDDQTHSISYEALHEGAGLVAARLIRKGIRRGDRVALMLPTGRDYFFSFFGILSAGGIPLPIYPPARAQQIGEHLKRHARILANAGAGFLITVPEARQVGRLLGAHVPGLRALLTLEDLHSERSTAPTHRAAAQDIAFLQYTSGSTGDPKGVILSHADLLANIRAMGQAAGVSSKDTFVSWLPLYHDMGLIGAWLGSLYYGMPLVCMSPLAFLARPLRWLQAIHRYRATLSAAPNFAYELCLSRIGDDQLADLDLSTWRWAFNGAEPVSAQTLRRFATRFEPCGLRREAIAPVYGLAEAAVGLAFPPPGRGPRIDCIDRQRLATSAHALRLPCDDPAAMEVVACGRPLPGYRVRVVDQEGRQLPERHEGSLQFQGPSATRGYYENPSATANLIRNGWHDTGDRGYLAGGDIHVTGRVKDLIIRGGRNIYPYELEEAVGSIPGVRQGCVAAFAAPDPKLASERLVVVAETRERDPSRRAELQRAVLDCCKDILALAPDEVVLAPPWAIPKTSSGKLRRGAARERYLAGRLTTGSNHPLWQLLSLGGSGLWVLTSSLGAKAPRYLYAGYVWSLLALIAPVVSLGILILPKPGWRWSVARGGASLLRRLSMVQLQVDGRERLPDADRPFVLTANHQSYLDALLMIEAIPRPLTFVAKRELQGIPVLGYLLARLNTLYVERFEVARSTADSQHFADILARGQSLAFFPEGTFRDDPGLLPFRMGAFATAAQARAPVVPVALSGTRKILPGDRRAPAPGKVRVTIGEALAPEREDWREAARLRDEARSFILRHCAEPDLKQSAGK